MEHTLKVYAVYRSVDDAPAELLAMFLEEHRAKLYMDDHADLFFDYFICVRKVEFIPDYTSTFIYYE